MKERSAKISENKWLQVVCICMCDVCYSGITMIGGMYLRGGMGAFAHPFNKSQIFLL